MQIHITCIKARCLRCDLSLLLCLYGCAGDTRKRKWVEESEEVEWQRAEIQGRVCTAERCMYAQFNIMVSNPQKQ